MNTQKAESVPTSEKCPQCGHYRQNCCCPLEQGQYHPDNPTFERPRKPHCVECGGAHEPSGARTDCIEYWRKTATIATQSVEWARALLCSATPNSKFLDQQHQQQWAEGFGKWFAESHTLPLLLNENGCAKQIFDWLNGGTYRIVMHRHNGTFRAVDDSDKLYAEADTLSALADYLSRWPECPQIKTLR